MNFQQYYETLSKPSFAPPPWLFGVVWPFLYLLIAVSFGYGIWQSLAARRWPLAVGIVMLINLAANALYTPLFFTWRLPFWAAADILIVWVTILAIMLLTWGLSRWVAILQVPYFIWVSFATVLQFSINARN